MVDVPPNCGGKTLFHAMSRLPPQFAADAGWINGVAPVMAWSVRHRCDQFGVGRVVGMELVELSTDASDNLFVGGFAVSADSVAAAGLPLTGGEQQRIHMVFDVEPVAHIEAVSIQGDWLSGCCFQRDHRDQFLGKLPGAVIV